MTFIDPEPVTRKGVFMGAAAALAALFAPRREAVGQPVNPPFTASLVSAVLSSATSVTANAITPRATRLRALDVGYSPLDFGAVWNGSSNPVSTALGTSYTTPAALAAYSLNGIYPFAWATNSIYGIAPFTQVTSAAASAGQPVIVLSGTAAFAQVPFAGLSASGTNIPSNTTVLSVSVLPDFKATITLSQNILTGGVASGATITFAMTATQIQAIEMDYLGTQSAIYAACTNTSAWGQRVIIPWGQGIFNNSTFAGLEIVLPTSLLTGPYWADGSTLLIAGQGNQSSIAYYPYDMGAGRFVCKPDPTSITGHAAAFVLQDFGFVGAGVGAATVQASFGKPNWAMNGILVIHKSICQRMTSSGFFCGIYKTWDHQTARDCYLQGNAYAIYYGYPVSGSLGDFIIDTCDCGGSLIAMIGVAWNNGMSDDIVTNVAGDNATCFAYRENQGTNTAVIPFIAGCSFTGCSVEGTFHAVLYDYNAVNHANYGSNSVGDNDWRNCLFSLNGGGNLRLLATTAYFPSLTIFAAYDIGSYTSNTFISGTFCEQVDFSTCTAGIIRAPGGSAGNSYINCGGWLSYATATVPAYANGVTGDTWSYNGLSGYIASWLGGTAAAGAIVSSYNGVGTIDAMANFTGIVSGQQTTPALGVLLAPGPSSGAVAYVTVGQIGVTCNAAAGLVVGQAAYVDHTAPGQAHSAAGNSGNARQFIGSCVVAQSGTSATIQWQPGPVV